MNKLPDYIVEKLKDVPETLMRPSTLRCLAVKIDLKEEVNDAGIIIPSMNFVTVDKREGRKIETVTKSRYFIIACGTEFFNLWYKDLDRRVKLGDELIPFKYELGSYHEAIVEDPYTKYRFVSFDLNEICAFIPTANDI